ncbi:hypothetical protein, partial [Faecalibacterium prausnitzii]|uniref:hypothetical protein n=1 Tax=Faecalibacterium prausnitzii TaxID=853 RepID=UPI0019D682FD
FSLSRAKAVFIPPAKLVVVARSSYPKQKIRTLLLSRKGSDFHGLVRVVIQHFLKTIVVQFVFEVIG